MTKVNVQYRDPQHLKTIHPALKHVPELPEGSEEFLALAAGVKRAGFIRPILIDQEERIIDDHSRNLARVARRWQFADVPVQVRSSEDAPMLLIHSLAHVRHLSKSAIAYLAVPQLQPALDAAKLRRLENLRKGQEIPESALSADSGPATMVELAEELGLGVRLLEMAIAVRKAFEDKKTYTVNAPGTEDDGAEMTLRGWFEPKILRPFVGGEHETKRPLGLGGIIAGIPVMRQGDKSLFAPKPKQSDFLSELFTRDVQKYVALSEAKKAQAIEFIARAAEELSPVECEQAAGALRAMAKVYADAAKGAVRTGQKA